MKRPSSSSLINIAGIAIVIYLVAVLAQTVMNNYRLQSQIDKLNTQISTLESQREELSYNLQYYQTDSFKEREARAKLGLQQPGESVIILPREDESAGNKDKKPAPKPRSNFRQWVDFLGGKG